MLNSALFDIINCEHDLVSHCEVEDKLFVPAVERLEEETLTRIGRLEEEEAAEESGTTADLSALTDRERDIVVCVAKGLSNKEIAEELNLSFYTVTTYRRNISAKLGIHSPPA